MLNINKELNNYIFIDKTSLSKELCQEIIIKYENEDNKFIGKVKSGIRPEIKNTTDFSISNDDNWGRIYNCLLNELINKLQKYKTKINKNTFFNGDSNNNYIFKLLDYNKFIIPYFNIQRYDANKGRYIYHDDFSVDIDIKSYRILTFIWYLNDVIEGGETELWGTFKIKPTAGKLFIFPAGWTFPHCGKMPISDNKYIITGWIYVNY
jgi:hypothetical protein